jgi:hypothetical protein
MEGIRAELILNRHVNYQYEGLDIEGKVVEKEKEKVELHKEDAAQVMFNLKVAELQKHVDDNRLSTIKQMQVMLANEGISLAKLVNMTYEQALAEKDRLEYLKEIDKQNNSIVDTVKGLRKLGLDAQGFASPESNFEGNELLLDFYSKRLSNAMTLVRKWQIIMIDQGKALDDILKLSYDDAKRLEEQEDRTKKAQKETEQALKEREQVIRQALDRAFADPMQRAFDSIIDGTRKVNQAFKDMIKGILRSIASLLFSELLKKFTNLLFNLFAGSLFGMPSLGLPGGGDFNFGPGGFGKPTPGGYGNMPSPRSGNIVIVQNIKVDKMLPHTEEALRRFTIDLNKLALKDARKILT